MYPPLYAALRPARVLFLCNEESSVRSDVRLMRGLGVSDILFSDHPRKALALLEDEALHISRGELPAQQRLDLVVCDERIHGLPAAAFIHALAQHSALRIKPLLVLAASASAAAALRAAGIQVLERPYAEQALREAMQKAMSPLRQVLKEADTAKLDGAGQSPSGPGACGTAKSAGPEQKSGANSDKAPARPKGPLTTTDRYQSAMSLLKQSAFVEAAALFSQVLHSNEDHVGAALALAKCRQALGDDKGMQFFLLRAAAACLRTNEKERAEAIAAMLPVGMRDKIYMHEALARMEQGEYREAALGFLDAAKEAPGQPLHKVIARACLLSRAPDADMSRLCDAFGRLGYDSTARSLRRRLLAYEPYAAPEAASWLDRFPLLQDVVQVASHTALAWRQL